MSAVWFAAPMLCSCRSPGTRSHAASAPQKDTWRTTLHPKNAVGTRSTSGEIAHRSLPKWPVFVICSTPYALAMPPLIALPEAEAQAFRHKSRVSANTSHYSSKLNRKSCIAFLIKRLAVRESKMLELHFHETHIRQCPIAIAELLGQQFFARSPATPLLRKLSPPPPPPPPPPQLLNAKGPKKVAFPPQSPHRINVYNLI